MNTERTGQRRQTRNRLAMMAVVGITAVSLHAGDVTIYSDDFSGSSITDLNGQAPDIRPGSETWTTHSLWKADGAIGVTSADANCFLPFVPINGKVYTLSLTVDVTSGGDNWFAFGFTPVIQTNQIFSGNAVYAAPWMLERAGGGANGWQTYAVGGPKLLNSVGYTSTDGPKNLKIVLDTRPTLWKVGFYRDGELLRTFTNAANPTINYVGVGKILTAGGTIDNFSLVDSTPPIVLPYSDDFSGASAASLNDQMLDQPVGAVYWAANDNWRADGALISTNNRNAFFPFSPESGKIYKLSFDLTVISAASVDWVGAGFAERKSTTEQFTSTAKGTAWLFQRANGQLNTVPGPNVTALIFAGTYDNSATRYDIVLNTMHTVWTVTYYRNSALLRSAYTYAANPAINYVGLGSYGSAVGTVDNLVLSDVTPPWGTMVSFY
jgi:hypothetical protein